MTLRLGARSGMVVAGTGSAFPSDLGVGEVLTNEDVYGAMLGPDALTELADHGWEFAHPRDVWGVERREWIGGASRLPGEADVSDLAARAVEVAVADAGLRVQDVDVLFAATSTPARISSALAAAVGKRLGITAPCLDMRAGGAGGLAAWLTAGRFLSDECPVAVVVAAETPSLFINPDDLAAALLYGDGAGALVLRNDPASGSGLLGAVLGHLSPPGQAFTIPGTLPPNTRELEAGRYQWQKPDDAYRAALADAWTSLCTDLREAFPGAVAAADYLVPYAVTAPQVRAAAAALGLDPAKTFERLARHGVLGCAGPLVGLDLLRREGGAVSGDVAALVAVAGGVSLAGMVWRL